MLEHRLAALAREKAAWRRRVRRREAPRGAYDEWRGSRDGRSGPGWNPAESLPGVMGAATRMHAKPTNEDHWMTSYSITNDATMKMGAPHRLCSSWNRSCSLFTSLLIKVTILPVVSS